MSKVVKFLKKSEQDKAAEALKVLEDLYAYYAPETDTPVAAGAVKEESALGLMYAYYSAA